eukprot:751658-Hanusia_phi.AAC.2
MQTTEGPASSSSSASAILHDPFLREDPIPFLDRCSRFLSSCLRVNAGFPFPPPSSLLVCPRSPSLPFSSLLPFLPLLSPLTPLSHSPHLCSTWSEIFAGEGGEASCDSDSFYKMSERNERSAGRRRSKDENEEERGGGGEIRPGSKE